MARSEKLQALLDKYQIETCRDGSCMFGSPPGQHTNGGCRCFKRETFVDQRMMYKLAMALREAVDG